MMNNLSRRHVLLAAAMIAAASRANAAETTAWGFSFPSIEEGTLDFAAYKGRVLLVANTASFCGYTYQYEGLEKLHASYTPQGLTVIGMPSQDFEQESGSNAAVKAFCDATFGVKFPMTGLTHVRGPDANAFYQWVKAEKRWQPSWNFNKVLIGRDGRIIETFGSNDEPTGGPMITAIMAALKASPAV
jgi:glutathione peroxidase